MTSNPFPFKGLEGGWSYGAWEDGYASTTGVNPYLPDNEQLGEHWQAGYDAGLHDMGEKLGRNKREREKRNAYFNNLYWP